MKMTRNRPVRVVLCALMAAGGVMAAAPSSAGAAGIVSQATAQAVNLNLLNGALKVAVSNPATKATNDGTQSNDEVRAQPAASLLGQEKLVTAGALSEVAEANQDGSSYGCAGIISPQGQVQVGDGGKSCEPGGNLPGGVTLDLGQTPGLTGLSTMLAPAGISDIKITFDAIVAHGYQNGTDPAMLGATLFDVEAHLGGLGVVGVRIDPTPNQDLLGAVLSAISPQLGAVGTAVSNLIRGVVSLTTNFQPGMLPNGSTSVSGLHIALLRGNLARADLAKVTVGPNAPSAPTDAFSFQTLPVIFGGLAALVALAYGVRFGVRRVRALA
jgi:hypothetical protein